mmetsp:Transcript_1443/g.4290  ORF Transcript_1443/g.4290 Transcript_1443/m.4290 type:complete len:472 (+) Transcript_1443:170-1585(+)
MSDRLNGSAPALHSKSPQPWFVSGGVPNYHTPPGSSRSVHRQGWLQSKHFIIAACFLATFIAYVERTGFSVAYTAAAKERHLDEAVKGTVLSSFFWGYALSQVPGGWAAQRWGGRTTLALSFILWSTASLMTPVNSQRSAPVAVARVLVGVSQGLLIPSIHTVLASCIPPKERATAVSLTTSGMYMGSAAAIQWLPGVATRHGAAAITRLNGCLGLAWLLLWMWASRLLPATSSGMPVAAGAGAAPYSRLQKTRGAATPWGRMMRHPAVWAIVVNNFTFHYAFYVVMNWLPTYFDSVLHAGLASAGSAKMLPYLVMFAMSNVGGYAGDWLIGRRYSVARARKMVNTAGFWGAAGSLALMPMASGVRQGVLVTSLTLGCCGCARGGFSVNHMDIAPKYAGVVMGVSNTAGTLAGVIGVALSGRLLDRAGGAAELAGWRHAFGLAAVLCISGSTVFIRFARGDKIFGETDQFT